MSEFFPLLSQFSAQATGALVSAAWQGALIAALVGLSLRLFPRLSSAARSVIWLNVFIVLALLHLVPFALGGGPAPRLAPHAVYLDSRWSLAIAGIWMALSVFRAVQLVLSALHLHALGRRAVTIDIDPELDPLLVAPFNRRVRLCASIEVARPSVLGFLRPRILVPPAVLDGLSLDEFRQIVIHEMEHLRRGDDWTNLLQKLALVVFPLNPALLWVERQLCAERELACDDRVLRSGSGRKAYALCLTHLAEFGLIRKGFSLALGAWERRPELVRRVQRILAQPVRTMGRKPALIVSGALLSGIFACTLTLAHTPQLVAFVPVGSSQQAHVLSALDTGSTDMIHGLAGGQARAFDAVMHTNLRAHFESAFARPVALRSHPARTLHPCPIKASRKHRGMPQFQPVRLAELRMPAEPAPAECPRTFAVLARWSDMQSTRRSINAVGRMQQPQHFNIVSAVYVVRTPSGWVIIEI